MQEKDLELLQILENNSRLSATEIATMINLTPADVESRIHALEIVRCNLQIYYSHQLGKSR